MTMTTRAQILFLTHRVPYPPNRGDRIRSYHMLRFLAQMADVHVACLADEPCTDKDLHVLQALGARVAIVPHSGRTRWLRAAWKLARGGTATEGLFESPGLRAIVGEWARTTSFDAVFTYCSSMWQYARIPELDHVPRVVDLVDVDSQKWFDYARQSRGPQRWLYQWEGARLRRLECDLTAQSRAVVLVSAAEAAIFQAYCPLPEKVTAITNGVDLDYYQPQPAESQVPHQFIPPRCVFVGALDYRANVDGVTWFCERIWPRIRERVRAATFAIVGRRPVEAVRRLGSLPGVTVVGEVDDVRSHLANAALVVVPLRIARGVQNKVLEALAMGKAVMASSESLEGLGLVHQRHVWQARGEADWWEGVPRLLADQALRQQLGENGRAHVEREHHWDACLAPLADVLGVSPRQSPASTARLAEVTS